MAPVWSKELLDIQVTIECRVTLKRVRAMIIHTVTFQHFYKKVQSTKKVK